MLSIHRFRYAMLFRLLMALCAAGLLLCQPAQAEDLELLLKLRQPDWVYPTCDALLDAGFAPGYPADMFVSGSPVSLEDFAEFVADVYACSGSAYADTRLGTGETLGSARDRLFQLCHNYLRVSSRSETQDDAQADWTYELCDMLVEEGFVSGYRNDRFDVSSDVTTQELASFVADLFEQTEQRDPYELVANGLRLYEARSALYEELKRYLMVTGVEVPPDRLSSCAPKFFDRRFTLLSLYELAGEIQSLRELSRDLDEIDAQALRAGREGSGELWQTVAPNSPIYQTFEKLSKAGLTEGYKAEAFDLTSPSFSPLSGYDFCVAFWRFQNQLSGTDDGRAILMAAGVTSDEYLQAVMFCFPFFGDITLSDQMEFKRMHETAESNAGR